MSSNILEQLRDEVERGDSWVPNDNPEHPNPLVGEAVEWNTGTTKDKTRECEVLVVKEVDGKTWSVWTWHAGLRAQLTGDKDIFLPVERRPVQAGYFVAIRYIGKFPRDDGDGEVHRYKTAIGRPDGTSASAEAATDDEPAEEVDGELPF